MHELAYAQAVASVGAHDWHTSWVIDDIGQPEVAASLSALVDWAKTGVPPPWPSAP